MNIEECFEAYYEIGNYIFDNSDFTDIYMKISPDDEVFT